MRNVRKRLPPLLPSSSSIRRSNDIPRRAQIRKTEPADLPLDMLDCWLSFRYVRQGIRDSGEVDVGGEKSIYASEYLCVYHLDNSVHFDADELFQQGVESVSYFDVSKIIHSSFPQILKVGNIANVLHTE